jgi:transcriptional regulator with XRE-family HTH domain
MAARRYCRCGNPLAHDHGERFCVACQRARRRDQAPDVPPEFWHTDAMSEALTSGDLGRVIRAYRAHPFWGNPLPQTTIADWLHVGQSTLSRIEQGKRRLTTDDVNWFARSLRVPWALRWVPEHGAEEDVDPISRRSLLGAGVGAALGLSATTAPASVREIDPQLVPHWTNLLRVLSRHDAMFGPYEVLDTARHELDLIAQHRRVARGALRREFLRVESCWSEFASWLSNDTGDRPNRDSWGDHSLRLAREAGFDDMVAWVLMRQSQWACNRPDPPQVVAFATAAHHTPGSSKQIRALCALQKAQGHALANDAAACERSIGHAHGLLEGAEKADPPQANLGRQDVTPAYVMAAEARCWVKLRPVKAIALLEGALCAWPRERARGRGIHQARLALACAAAGEPDRAAVEGIKALDIAQTTRSDLTARELRRLDRQLAATDLPAATELREALATL